MKNYGLTLIEMGRLARRCGRIAGGPDVFAAAAAAREFFDALSVSAVEDGEDVQLLIESFERSSERAREAR